MLARLASSQRLQAKFDDSDLVQETLVRVQRDLPKFQGATEAELAAWLRRIMANVGKQQVQYYSRQRRDASLEQQIEEDFTRSSVMVGDVVIASDTSPSRQLMKRERAVVLSQALANLPADYREALIFNRLQGHSVAQTAERMGRSVDSVRKLLSRGLLQLKRELEGCV
jgi:RNA polymerase sigma-70 factor (ECF subfamily)